MRVQAAHVLEYFPVATTRAHRRFLARLMQIVRFQVHHVVRQLITHGAIVFFASTKEADGKTQVGKAAYDLVDPARHAAADIGEGSFQQKTDIGTLTRADDFHDVRLRWSSRQPSVSR